MDSECELNLIARQDPLIDLALAQFCRSDEAARALFTQARYINSNQPHERAVRLGVLDNRCFGGLPKLYGLPKVLFDPKTGGLGEWLAEAHDEEIDALFGNPIIDQYFLRDFLEGKAIWQAVDEPRRQRAVVALSNNPRMRSVYKGPMDGYAEYTFNSVFHAAWAMSKTLPVTREWSNALGLLYQNLARESYNMEDALQVAERWRPEPDDEASLENEAEIAKYGHVWLHSLVRQALVKLIVSNDRQRISEFLASDDHAFRAAIYELGEMNPEQILAAYERDKNLAANCCQQNLYIWRSPQTRKALYDISWGVCTFNDNYMDSANAYNDKADELKAKYPDWFKDEEPNDWMDEDEKAAITPATKADTNAATEIIGGTEGLVRESMAVSSITSNIILPRLQWVWWFALGALVVSLWRFFM